VTFESLLHPATILFVVGFIFGLVSPQFRNRRKMMFCKFMGDGFIGLYLFALGGMSGACGAMIASSGAFIQSMTPHKYLKQTIWLRIGAAVTLSAASIYFVYKTPLDLLPLSMVIVCRFGELQPHAQRIRIVYWATSFPWMIYHFLNGFYLPFFACIIGSTSLLVSIIRHHHPQKNEEQTQ
jgi:hypothetical protein